MNRFEYNTIVTWKGIIGKYGILYHIAGYGEIFHIPTQEEIKKYTYKALENKK